jgi:hypothetical protein
MFVENVTPTYSTGCDVQKHLVPYNKVTMHLRKKISRGFIKGLFVLAVLCSAQVAAAGTLTDFSYSADSYVAGDTATYTFSYTLETADPDRIFHTYFPATFDLTNATAEVTINGVAATVDTFFHAPDNETYITLTPTTAPAGADIVVTIADVINTSTLDDYSFEVSTTDGSGTNIDATNGSNIFYINGEPFSGEGEGTVEVPYQITSCSELQEVSNNRHHHYILMNDIDCTESATWNINLDEFEGGDSDEPLIPDSYSEETGSEVVVVNNGYYGFEPIGNSDNPFTGTLDGDGYTISNLWIFRKGEQNIGLFGRAEGADISNVGLTDSDIVGQYSTGGIVGSMFGGTADNITLEDNMVRAYLSYRGGGFAGEMQQSADGVGITNTGGFVHGSGSVIGGIVGYMQDSSIVSSHSSASIDGGDNLGGFVGYMVSSFIDDSYTTGNVSSDRLEYPFVKSGNNTGGFVGYMTDESTIEDSYATGQVETTGNYAGGFAGQIVSGSIIEDSYATGNVTGTQETIEETTYDAPGYLGGFTGLVFQSNLSHTYATGDVESDGIGIGGFSGLSGCTSEISYSYALGDVSGGDYVGGFTGEDGCEGPGTAFSQVFATGDVTGDEYVGGFAGRISIGVVNDGYASGLVTGNSYTGGFAGSLYYTDLDNVYSRAVVSSTGETFIGSFVGKNFNDGEPIEGIWDTTVATIFGACGTGDNAECFGVEGERTENMNTQAMFENAGYDFESVWVMDTSNDGYPYFYFGSEPAIVSVTPADGATDVLVTSDITIEFAQSMNTEADPLITSGPCDEECPSFTSEWSGMGTVLILTKGGDPFAYDTTYTISIENLETELFVPLDAYEWSFTTEADPNPTVAQLTGRSGSSSGRRRSSGVSSGSNSSSSNTAGTTTTTASTAGATQTGASESSIATVRDLTLTFTGDDVKQLQQILIAKNTGPKAVALAGVGATGYFGAYTRDALAEYQQVNGIAPAIGYFGPRTRAQMKTAGILGLWW